MLRLLPLGLFFVTASLLPADEIRVWTDITGKAVRGTYAGLDIQHTATGDTVKVRMTLENGVAAAVPLERLSPADQDFVRQQAAHALGGATPPAATSPPPAAPPSSPSRPAAVARPVKPVRLASREAAQGVLAKMGSAEFIETPLSDVCQSLSEQFKVAIEIDRKGLEEAGVAADLPITLNLERATLREILTAVLKPQELSFRFANGGFSVSSIEVIENQMVSLTYRVNDLMPLAPGPGGGVMADPESLLDLITTNVAPDSWSDVGGPGSATVDPRSLMLVVSNSESVHEQLSDFLKTLRSRPRR